MEQMGAEPTQEMKNEQPRKALYFPHIEKELMARVLKDEHPSLTEHINTFYFKNYSEQQRRQIYQLIQSCQKVDILDDQFLKLAENEKNQQYFKEVQILSARIYQKLIVVFEDIKYRNILRDNLQPRDYLYKQRLQYSYDKYFLEKRVSMKEYDYIGRRHEEKPNLDRSLINQVYKFITESGNQQLIKLFQFIERIGLILLDDIAPTNAFLCNLQRITKKQQKKMYLENIAMEQFETIYNIKINKDFQQITVRSLAKTYPNYWFYLNKSAKSISILHTKEKDYKFLQDRHDYIQWMFPNHYGSSFNSAAFPLNYIESYLFNQDIKVGFSMLKSIYIFFDFMGIQIDFSNNFDLSISSQKRLQAVILIHHHNHLRIMRILSCLSVTGFRIIALKLIQFLDKYTQKGQILSKQRREFENSWNIYGNQGNSPKDTAISMCFLQLESFPEQHRILRLVREIIAHPQRNILEIDVMQNQDDHPSITHLSNESKQKQAIKQEDIGENQQQYKQSSQQPIKHLQIHLQTELPAKITEEGFDGSDIQNKQVKQQQSNVKVLSIIPPKDKQTTISLEAQQKGQSSCCL